jgi:hypothetical protein
MRQAAKPFVALMVLLGITSGIGAIQHGNPPWLSFQVASGALLILILLNVRSSDE